MTAVTPSAPPLWRSLIAWPLWRSLIAWPTASIRRQLGWGIALLQALVMTLFVVDITADQHAMLMEMGRQRTESLARVVAVNSSSWVAAGDVRGLQEVITAISQHGDVIYAMVVDRRGAVLAHTDGDKVGLFLTDEISRSMIGSVRRDVLRLVDTTDMVDLAVPVMVGDRLGGWARIALDQAPAHRAALRVISNGAIYTLVAILGGTLFALWIAGWLTRRLHGMAVASEGLRRGETVNLPDAGGRDEVARLADTFRAMASTIQRREAELRTTIDKLATSNAELERFAYVASHDLQEPLRTIVSYGQLMERRYKGRLDADADEFIQFMTDASMRLHRMVQALLEVSRAGSKGTAFALVDLGDVVRSAMENLQQAIAESGARVTVAAMPEVWGDQTQLIQVFQNLIANAVKFRRPDIVPEVSIAAEAMDGMLAVTVCDNGIGVPEENREEVFVIFRRLHAAGEYPGSGVGLAVCRRIVESHGGSIRCLQRDSGAGFVITLPLSQPNP